MKKLLLVLGMITCMFGMTACGGSKVEVVENYGVTEEQAAEYAVGLIETMNEVVVAGQEELYESDAVVYSALGSFSAALSEIGDYQSVIDHEVVYNDGIIITSTIDGTLKDATVEIVLDKELLLTGISTNVIYTFSEMMTRAALNTLMGMGTVFVVLVLISFLISSFSLIPKIQEKLTKKPEVKEDSTEKAVTQIIAQEEADETDDLELVAVIAAAIAAYEGSASADGYVVRSIKRRRR